MLLLTSFVDAFPAKTSSLQKYCKFYHLTEAEPDSTKEELIPIVSKHFATQVVDEDEVLLNFSLALKKQSYNSKPNPSSSAAKKPRHAAKPKGR